MLKHVTRIGVALGLLGAAAEAEPLVPARDFPAGGACYGRTYDSAHLGRHPGQVVAEIFAWGSSRSLVADRPLRDSIDPELALTMRVVTADGRIAQGDVGCPEIDGRITRCGRSASCGGDVAIDMRPDGTLRLVNDDADRRASRSSQPLPGFSVDAECPKAGRVGLYVPPDPENRVFLLARLPMAACAGR